MKYIISGHAKLKLLREIRERDHHNYLWNYYPVEEGMVKQAGHYPSLDTLDNKTPLYTRLVDYA